MEFKADSSSSDPVTSWYPECSSFYCVREYDRRPHQWIYNQSMISPYGSLHLYIKQYPAISLVLLFTSQPSMCFFLGESGLRGRSQAESVVFERGLRRDIAVVQRMRPTPTISAQSEQLQCWLKHSPETGSKYNGIHISWETISVQ